MMSAEASPMLWDSLSAFVEASGSALLAWHLCGLCQQWSSQPQARPLLTLASALLPSWHVAVLAGWPLGTVSMSSFPVLATAGFHQLILDSWDWPWAVGLRKGHWGMVRGCD